MENIQQNWKVWWDEENKVVHHWSRGENDEQMAKDSSNAVVKIIKEHPVYFGMLVDMSDVTTVVGRARQSYADLTKKNLKKAAFYGTNMITRAIVKMVFSFAKNADIMKIFGTEAEALAWLKEK